MSLATRCPHCQTVFQLAAQQLQLRQGMVRCGHCLQVFNGARAQLETGAAAPPEIPNAPEPGAPRPGGRAEPSYPQAGRSFAANPPNPPFPAEPSFAAAAKPSAAAQDMAVTPVPETADTRDGEPAQAAERFSINGERRPAYYADDAARAAPRAPRAGHGGRIIGTLVALVLLVALAAQIAWWQRDWILLNVPQAQPLFQQFCGYAGCTVGPVHATDRLRIEATSLNRIENDAHRLELKLQLHNLANVAVAYPAVELTLLDAQDQVAIRRVITPRTYLPSETPSDAGLAPGASVPVLAQLDTGAVAAGNYRVVIFYP